MRFEYFNGRDPVADSYMNIPKCFNSDPVLNHVSINARYVYGMMLDRMKVSAMNNMVDKEGKTYIYYDWEEIAKAANISKNTVYKVFDELDTVNGIGLIERVKMGQGKQSRIYVMRIVEAEPDVLNRSPKSIEAYKNALYIYLNFLKEKYNVENEQITFDYFKVENLTAFIAWMKQEKVYKPKTINLRMTAIRSFLKYCALQDLELKDLSYCANSIPDVKVPKRPIEFLTEDAIKAILSATSYDKPIHRRNRMLIILMYDTGARVSELSGAMLSSLHLKAKNPYIVLHGKGDKTRNVPLMEKTMLHLAEYLKEFHDDRSDAPLFYCRHDGIKHNLSNDSIETILKNVAAKARETCNEVPERVYCHLIRKTRAMDLYKQKISLPIIAQLLGHESISTTSGFYAFATLDMMADAMKTANEHAALPEKEWKNAEIMNLLYTLD